MTEELKPTEIRCSKCNEWTDIATGFYKKVRHGKTIELSNQQRPECKICRRKRSAQNYLDRKQRERAS
jgi:hypothetical protein